MIDPRKELRINIGFLLNQTVGYSRDFHLDLPELPISLETMVFDFKGSARFNRTPQGLLVNGGFSAKVKLDCVRCLESFEQVLETRFDELFAFTERTVTDSGLILPDDGYIDLYPLVCEYLLIEIPISPLCRSECQGLCPVCGTNLNDNECEHQAGKGGGEMK